MGSQNGVFSRIHMPLPAALHICSIIKAVEIKGTLELTYLIRQLTQQLNRNTTRLTYMSGGT